MLNTAVGNALLQMQLSITGGEDPARAPRPSLIEGEDAKGNGHSKLGGGVIEEISVCSPTKARANFATARVLAKDLLAKLAPMCPPEVFGRLDRENVITGADLAMLDKEDLRELGFNMVDRRRVLEWIERERERGGKAILTRTVSFGGAPEFRDSWVPSAALAFPQPVPTDSEMAMSDDPMHRRLDEVEQKKEFWCDLIATSTAIAARPVDETHSDSGHSDVRENIIEMLFDLTPERVKEVYSGIDLDADGCISAAELGRGLHQYKLPDIGEAGLGRVLEEVTAGGSRRLQLLEFEAVLSRLKLAQLLHNFGPRAGSKDNDYGVDDILTVVDYSHSSANVHNIKNARLSDFFFGHRQPSLVRWVHSRGLNMIVLLALTVKYSLHPLSVEDVIEQSPTKIDRNGQNFFLAIEQLLLSGMADGSVPVHVEGRHVAVFCAGPPHFDTVITVAQRDFSFESDWPVVFGEVPSEQSDLDKWVERLQDRLKAPLSRLRERRADFLMYQIIDLCTDELLDVMRAYTKRLAHIDDALREQGAGLPPSASSEVSTIRLQLAVVARRLRGLQRVLRNMIDNPDLTTGLSGYFRDVADHLDEALGDTGHLADRCAAIIETYQRALDRGREMVNQQASERLNKTLFVLTVATTVFAPLQFVAGIYGMNFADSSGKPSIPELLWAKGYLYFWCFVVFYLILCIFFSICLFRRLQRRDRKAGMSRQTPLGDTEVGGSRQMSPGVAYVETAEIRRRRCLTCIRRSDCCQPAMKPRRRCRLWWWRR